LKKDKSFYGNKKNFLDKISFIINNYSGDDYSFLNDFLREGKVQKFS